MNAAAKKKLDEKHEKILTAEARKPENAECFECTQKGPFNVVLDLLTFVCQDCAGILRGSPFNFRIKGILASSFTQEEVKRITTEGGNARAAKVWLGSAGNSFTKPFPGDTNRIRLLMDFKYIRKKFYVDPQQELPVVEPLTVLGSKLDQINTPPPTRRAESSSEYLPQHNFHAGPGPVSTTPVQTQVVQATIPTPAPKQDLLGLFDVQTTSSVPTPQPQNNTSLFHAPNGDLFAQQPSATAQPNFFNQPEAQNFFGQTSQGSAQSNFFGQSSQAQVAPTQSGGLFDVLTPSAQQTSANNFTGGSFPSGVQQTNSNLFGSTPSAQPTNILQLGSNPSPQSNFAQPAQSTLFASSSSSGQGTNILQLGSPQTNFGQPQQGFPAQINPNSQQQQGFPNSSSFGQSSQNFGQSQQGFPGQAQSQGFPAQQGFSGQSQQQGFPAQVNSNPQNFGQSQQQGFPGQAQSQGFPAQVNPNAQQQGFPNSGSFGQSQQQGFPGQAQSQGFPAQVNPNAQQGNFGQANVGFSGGQGTQPFGVNPSSGNFNQTGTGVVTSNPPAINPSQITAEHLNLMQNWFVQQLQALPPEAQASNGQQYQAMAMPQRVQFLLHHFGGRLQQHLAQQQAPPAKGRYADMFSDLNILAKR